MKIEKLVRMLFTGFQAKARIDPGRDESGPIGKSCDPVNNSAGNQFERKPLIAWLVIIGWFLFTMESLLRIVAPDALRFIAHGFRQVYRYHNGWYTDFEPGTTTHIHLAASDGYLLNFLVSANDHGFRFPDRPTKPQTDAEAPRRSIHAIGDSFTMGWRVNYESSYLGLLDSMLLPDYEVLNLV